MTKNYDIVFIGHFAIDTIIYNNIKSHSVGGGVTYGSLAAFNYNNTQKLGIISEVGKDFTDNYLDLFTDTDIDLNGICKSSEKSTNYKLFYHDGVRDLTLESKAESIDFSKFPEEMKDAKCFMLAPIANEIPEELINDIIENTDAMIAADVQGFIRKFNDDGTINKKIDSQIVDRMQRIIKKCNGRMILKASDEEANYIAKNENVIESTKILGKLTNAIILTTLGPDGSLIKFQDNKMIHVPALLPNVVVDETGAGDCYSAVFISEYCNSDKSWDAIKKAGYCASAACSYLLQKKGPNGFATSELVQKRLESMKTIPSKYHEIIKSNNF